MRMFCEHLAPKESERERWNWRCLPQLKLTNQVRHSSSGKRGQKYYSNGGPFTWKLEARGKGGSHLTFIHHSLSTYPPFTEPCRMPSFHNLELDRIRIGLRRFCSRNGKGRGNPHPRISWLKETLKLTEPGSPLMLGNIYSIFFLPNGHSLSAWICHWKETHHLPWHRHSRENGWHWHRWYKALYEILLILFVLIFYFYIFSN